MKIKDYLKYYIGQQCQIADEDGKANKFILTAYNYNYYKEWHSDIKPILRRLSSITEEEKLHIVENITHSHIAFSASNAEILTLFEEDKYLNRSRVMELLPEEFHYLIYRGFWLWDESAFTTGLIIEKK